MDIKSVLVCDAVDAACVNLLNEFDIQVTYKLKMPPAELCEEVKVGIIFRKYASLGDQKGGAR